MVNVVVTRKRNVRISSNATGGIIDSTIPVTIKKTDIRNSLGVDDLNDVDLTSRTNGSTLVYDSESTLYAVRPLQFNEINGDLDGGVF